MAKMAKGHDVFYARVERINVEKTQRKQRLQQMASQTPITPAPPVAYPRKAKGASLDDITATLKEIPAIRYGYPMLLAIAGLVAINSLFITMTQQ